MRKKKKKKTLRGRNAFISLDWWVAEWIWKVLRQPGDNLSQTLISIQWFHKRLNQWPTTGLREALLDWGSCHTKVVRYGVVVCCFLSRFFSCFVVTNLSKVAVDPRISRISIYPNIREILSTATSTQIPNHKTTTIVGFHMTSLRFKLTKLSILLRF